MGKLLRNVLAVIGALGVVACLLCGAVTFGLYRFGSSIETQTAAVTATFSKTPSITPTRTPTFTPSVTLTSSSTFTPSQTFTPSTTFTPSETFTPSDTATVTPTPTATDTFTPTNTVTLTNTPTATFTPSGTATYTPTLSKTDIAATAIIDNSATAQVKRDSASATASSKNDDATIAAQNKNNTATQIADDRNATSQARSDSVNATRDARGVTATFVAGYKPISLGELNSYANKHIGEDVIIHGTVILVVDDLTLQISVPPLNIIYVKLANTQPLSGIYQQDYITVYGTVAGFLPGSDALGASFREAELINASVTKP